MREIMAEDEKCSKCGEVFETGLDGITKCKNGHEKEKKMSHYSFPLSEPGGSFYKKKTY